MSRAMHAIPFCLRRGRISRRPADTLICKRVNRGPVRLLHAVNCELAALSSVLNGLLNDYINGSRILRGAKRVAQINHAPRVELVRYEIDPLRRDAGSWQMHASS